MYICLYECMNLLAFIYNKPLFIIVMGIKGRRVHMIEELSETIISFQRGKNCCALITFAFINCKAMLCSYYILT